jgi:hypothetical protein
MHLVELPFVVRDGSRVQVERSIWEAELEKIQRPLQLKFDQFKVKMDHDLNSLLSANNVID